MNTPHHLTYIFDPATDRVKFSYAEIDIIISTLVNFNCEGGLIWLHFRIKDSVTSTKQETKKDSFLLEFRGLCLV